MSQLSGIPLGLGAQLPSPTQSVWHLGPIPVRAYALCILAGIVVAVWLTSKRLAARDPRVGLALDVSAWAVPFGIVGGRIYHVLTDWSTYFGPDRAPGVTWVDTLKIYEGGLGIWGAVALGAFGAWLGCRHHGLPFRDFIDAAAPGLAIAQATGRFGNWFNNELFGGPTDLPWRLKVYQWDQGSGHAVLDAAGEPLVRGYFHPTFLYEALWCLALAAVLIWLSRRLDLARGQTFAAYVMGYPIGRIVWENIRTDHATHIFGQRVNTWTSILVFLLGLFLWWRCSRLADAHAPAEAPADGDDESAEVALDAPDEASETLDEASPEGAEGDDSAPPKG